MFWTLTGTGLLKVCATPGHTAGCVTYDTGEEADQSQTRIAFTRDDVLEDRLSGTQNRGKVGYKEPKSAM